MFTKAQSSNSHLSWGIIKVANSQKYCALTLPSSLVTQMLPGFAGSFQQFQYFLCISGICIGSYFITMKPSGNSLLSVYSIKGPHNSKDIIPCPAALHQKGRFGRRKVDIDNEVEIMKKEIICIFNIFKLHVSWTQALPATVSPNTETSKDKDNYTPQGRTPSRHKIYQHNFPITGFNSWNILPNHMVGATLQMDCRDSNKPSPHLKDN